MEPHIDVITLAVGDLDRSLAFYRDGLATPGVTGTEFVGEFGPSPADRAWLATCAADIAPGSITMTRTSGCSS